MLNEQSKNAFRGSFIKLIGDEIGLPDIPEPTKEDWGYSLLLDGRAVKGARCLCFLFESPQWTDEILDILHSQVHSGDHIILAMPPTGKTGLLQRFFRWKRLLRKFEEPGYSVTGLYGVDPAPWDTHILFDLRKNILEYVEAVSLRYLDNPVKHFLKKLLLLLLGTSSWQGWIVATLNTSKEKKLLQELTNHYLILTPDRTISLVFEKAGRSPVFAEKKGLKISLHREWQNHIWAREKLGNSVPDIYDFSTSGETAILKMEYIPERNMSNVVAQSIFHKKELESQTRGLINFFISILHRVRGNATIEKRLLSESVRLVVQEGLQFLYDESVSEPDRIMLDNALREMMFPLIPQHGDFCVRNILYRDSGEKVLIDWEDSELQMLPGVDLNMLQVSLSKSWAGLLGGDETSYHRSTAIKQHLAEVEESMRQHLNMTIREWRICNLLSLAYLAGININKGRGATVAKIKEEFRLKVTSSRSN